MNNAEIKELTNKELAARIRDERANLTKLKLNNAISPVDNPNVIKENKRLIARMLTEQRRRQLSNVQ